MLRLGTWVETLLGSCALVACRGAQPSSSTQKPTTVHVMVIEAEQPEIRPVADLAWVDLNVPGLTPGVKIALLHGDPASAGDYTLRLSFPDGYVVPPLWHPMPEHLTVLSGTLLLGMGQRYDPAATRAFQAGDFVFIPAKMAYFGRIRGQTVIQFHGDGPFGIDLVGAAPSAP